MEIASVASGDLGDGYNKLEEKMSSDVSGLHESPSSLSGHQGMRNDMAIPLIPRGSSARPPILHEDNVHDGQNCSWYHAGFHFMTVMVGTGVLGLPGAMAKLTWLPGIAVLALAYIAAYYTAVLLSMMHIQKSTNTGAPPVRLNSYIAIGKSVMGRKFSMMWIMPFQYTLLVGTAIAYLVAAGEGLRGVYLTNCHQPCRQINQFLFTAGIAVVELFLSLFPSLESVSFISILAALASFVYCIIAVVLSAYLGRQPDVAYNRLNEGFTAVSFDIFQGIATIVFAFGVHAILPEVQATLRPFPSPVIENIKGVSLTWAFVLVLYLGSAVAGYWAFGSTVDSNLLESIEKANGGRMVKALLTVASIMVVFHVLIAYQVMSMPVFAAMEAAAERRSSHFSRHPKLYRLPLRWGYIALTTFVAMLLPFFGTIMSLFGALGMTPLNFIIPCIMYVTYRGLELTITSRVVCYVIIGCSVAVGLFGTVSSIHQLVMDASTFKLFA